MNSTHRIAFAAAVMVVAVAACSPAAVAPPSLASRSPVASQSARVPSLGQSSPSQPAASMTVGGTDVTGPVLHATIKLPTGWDNLGSAADVNGGEPPGVGFFLSLLDNTFKDPCTHVQRSPKIGSTVADAAAAIGEIPDTTATKPLQTTFVGHPATYLELRIPASLPCAPDQFYLWQDSPGGDWWALGLNATIRVWILEVGGLRVAIAARSYAGSSAELKTELQQILDSIVFDVGS